jgi:hypothetical protein
VEWGTSSQLPSTHQPREKGHLKKTKGPKKTKTWQKATGGAHFGHIFAHILHAGGARVTTRGQFSKF